MVKVMYYVRVTIHVALVQITFILDFFFSFFVTIVFSFYQSLNELQCCLLNSMNDSFLVNSIV